MTALSLAESAARTKWCPFVRVGIYPAHSVNRHPSDDADRPEIRDETRCLASGCAVWQEDRAAIAGREAAGHCGLVGRVQP